MGDENLCYIEVCWEGAGGRGPATDRELEGLNSSPGSLTKYLAPQTCTSSLALLAFLSAH